MKFYTGASFHETLHLKIDWELRYGPFEIILDKFWNLAVFMLQKQSSSASAKFTSARVSDLQLN